jgi:hypothetical protein
VALLEFIFGVYLIFHNHPVVGIFLMVDAMSREI